MGGAERPRRGRPGARWARRRDLRPLRVARRGRSSGPPPPRRPARRGAARPAWRPRRPSPWSWSDPPRAGRPRAWRSRRFWGGVARCWPPASRAISSATRWGRGRAWARCGASTRRAPRAHGPVPGRRSPAAASGVRRAGPPPNCARRPRAKGRRRTGSSGTPRRPSSWPRSSSRRRSTAAPWPTSCAGSTRRRSARWPPFWSAPRRPRCCTRPRRPGAVTTARAAPSTPRPRRCSPPSPIRRPGRRRTAPSSRAICWAAAHTLYLCAPAHDQRRLRGYFTALTQAVLSHAFASATKSGRPLDPPLLVVLDEAAHIAPLPELDGLAATCASHGIQIVTVWQDLAQVRGRYGARAPTVLNNHRAKLFLPGIADPDTLEYASRLIGDEEASHPSVTRDPTGRRSTTSTTAPRRLLPPEALRCLPRGRAVLVYGTLPPARLQLRPWWAQGRRTASRPVGAGDGRDGRRAPVARRGRGWRGPAPRTGSVPARWWPAPRPGRTPSAASRMAPEPVEQVAAHAGEEVVALERARLDQLVDQVQGGAPGRRPWRRPRPG